MKKICSLYCFLLILLVLTAKNSQSQPYYYEGRVLDAYTLQPLAFVNIVTDENHTGTATDIDGKFSVTSAKPVQILHFSYVGYHQLLFPVKNDTSFMTIFLQKSAVELKEVVIIAGENPALRIIRNIISNKDRNDPEKLRSFSYTSYDKMIFTVDTTRIPSSASDSGVMRLRRFLNDKELFIMETVAERKFLAPDRNHEKILATRISGFQDPLLLFLSSQLQSTSFYREMIQISDKNYISPISKGSPDRYSYIIEDTTFTASKDTVFIISFKPRVNTNFDGLTGVFWINSDGWAIQNVTAEPARQENSLSIKIRQMYELVDDKQWFPVQLNTDIFFNNIRVNEFSPLGSSRSYLRDITLNPDLVRKQFDQIFIEIDPNATERNEDFWTFYRIDSLSDREKRTYTFIDSIGRELQFDRFANNFKSLIRGRLPVGALDVDLSNILKYNDYEKLYLGLGLTTNQKFSRVVEVGGFFGYGFGDKKVKFGVEAGILFNRYNDLKLSIGYDNFATETGGVEFPDDKNSIINPANFRDFFIRQMDQTKQMHASLNWRPLRYTTLNAKLKAGTKLPPGLYQFADDGGTNQLNTGFNFTELTTSIRFAYREQFIETPDSRISLGTNFPIVYLQYTRGFDNFACGEFPYNKFDVKINASRYIKFFGQSTLHLMAGYVDQPLPISGLYNGRGSYAPFSIYAPDAFVTMRMNEFLADRYLYAFYTHNFGSLLFRTKGFEPEICITSNFGTGSLKQPGLHKNIEFKIMKQIYCESGLMLNNLLSFQGFYNLGLGVFYRYGYYHLPKTADNFTYRLTINFLF
ncbi:MAG: carboxypeptidase-like regulatory domain-containing protein [Sphingobacteriia bacterium]|nr:carboxypeptidase-like regulatory domain-containing protein [Sphingobacteriia bacterium]